MFATDAKKRREKRQRPRQKVLLPAYFSLPRHDLYLQPCILKDVSETGCQVVGRQVESIASSFILHADVFDGPRRCSMAWRSRYMIGARFDAQDQVDSGPSEPAETPAADRCGDCV